MRHLQPAIFPQAAHSVAARYGRNGTRVVTAHDLLADLVVQLHQFEDSHSSRITGTETILAAATAKTWHGLAIRGDARPIRPFTAIADQPDPPLRQHRHQGRADEVIFYAHVGEPRDGARSVVGVQRRIDEMAGKRGTD